jgi:hypothetical protein
LGRFIGLVPDFFVYSSFENMQAFAANAAILRLVSR